MLLLYPLKTDLTSTKSTQIKSGKMRTLKPCNRTLSNSKDQVSKSFLLATTTMRAWLNHRRKMAQHLNLSILLGVKEDPLQIHQLGGQILHNKRKTTQQTAHLKAVTVPFQLNQMAIVTKSTDQVHIDKMILVTKKVL